MPKHQKNQQIQSLDRLVDQSDDIIIRLSADGSIVEFNRQAEAEFGCTQTEVFETEFFSTAAELNWDISFLVDAVSPQKSRLSDGFISWKINKLNGVSNNSNEYVIVGVRLSKSAYQNQMKGYSQVYFRNIISNIPQFIFWKDTGSIYLGCNENYAKLVGLNSSSEIIGKTDYDIGWLADGDTAEIFRERDADVMSGNLLVNVEQVLSVPSGKKITVLINKAPILDNDGKVLGILGMATDISARKQVQIELEEAKEHAEQSSQSKSDFIANMSHDFRTPLNAIMSMAEVLRLQEHTNNVIVCFTDNLAR